MSEENHDPQFENSWVDIIGEVLDYYEKDRQGTMFGLHGKTAYPVATLALLKTNAERYAREDLAEAFRGVSEHLFAHIQNGTAKISTSSVLFDPEEIPPGESQSIDIALGRTETSPAELGKMLFDNMYQLSMDDERYHYNFQYWKDAAQNAISFMESGVEVIPDNPRQNPNN